MPNIIVKNSAKRFSISLAATLALLLTTSLAHAEQFVWRVPGQSGDATNSVYLVGSVHLLPPRAYPLPPAFETAYQASDLLMFETDMAALQSPQTQFRLMGEAAYPAGVSLGSSLPPALLRRLQTPAQNLGVPFAVLDRFKPWFAATLIELSAFTKAGFRADLGLDTHFYQRALSDNKGVYGLETLDAHLAVLTEMPPALSQAYLSDTLHNLSELDEAPNKLFDFWNTGNAAGLSAYVEEQSQADPALYRRLVEARNKAWLADIEALLNGNVNAMIVVGALHLAGAQGLPKLLQARGYKPEQL